MGASVLKYEKYPLGGGLGNGGEGLISQKYINNGIFPKHPQPPLKSLEQTSSRQATCRVAPAVSVLSQDSERIFENS